MILIPELQNQNGILILIYSSVNFLRVSTSVSEKLVLKKFWFRKFWSRYTAVKPGIYGLAFTMGKWFLTENSATVGRILMISSADPHEILILIKW